MDPRAASTSDLCCGDRSFTQIAEDDAAFEDLFFDSQLGTVCWPNGANIAPETLFGLADVVPD